MDAMATVTFSCEKGHVHKTLWDMRIGRQKIEQVVRLIDGTSPEYAHPPDKDSVIGKCGECFARLKRTTIEWPAAPVIE